MLDKERIVITGIGMISSNGNNANEFLNNSIDGKSGIVPCTLFNVSNLKTEYVGQIQKEMPYETDSPGDLERINYIMESAISELLEDSNISPDEIDALGDRAYLSFATSLASNGRIMSYIKDMNKGNEQPEWLLQIPSFVPWIKERCGIQGGCYTTMAACASGSTSAGIAFDLIRENKAELVIVGGVDPMTEFSCVGFHALKALSSGVCKPFSKNRDGINIGEAGAFLVFESLEHAKKRNVKIYAEVFGYGINNDAYHITSPDPEGKGAFASMQMAVKESGIKPSEVDLINAHGTGTGLNDIMECDAIQRFLGDNKNTYVISNKGLVAHCMGAAGTVELVATVLCIKNKLVMPNVNVTEVMEEFQTGDFVDKVHKTNIRFALSNSFAFAGNTASIIIGAYGNE